MSSAGEAAPEVVRRIERVGRLLALGAAVLAFVVLVGGWWLGIEWMRKWRASFAPMKANTAASVFLLGVTLWLEIAAPMRGRRVLFVVAGAVVATVLATLAEDLFGVSFGIDGILVLDPQAALAAPRMSPMTAVAIALLGSAAIFLPSSSGVAQRLGQLCALLALGCGAIDLAGYIFGVEALYRVPGFVSVAPQTALCLVSLALAALCVRPRVGVMRVYSASSTAGSFMRRLVPFIVLVPVILGWLRLRGEELGLYEMRFGLALFVVVNVVTLVVLTGLAAARLHGVEQARRRDQDALAAGERSLAMAQRIAHIGSWEEELSSTDDRSRATTHGSEELWRIFGTRPDAAASARDALLAAVHPDDRERVQLELTRAIRERTPYRTRLRIRRAGGEERLAEAHAEVTYDERGAPQRVAGTLQDITEAQRLEDALRLSENRLKLIYEAILDPTYLIEINTSGAQRIVSMNRAAEEYLGRPRTAVVGILVGEVNPGPGAVRATAAVARAVNERRVVEYEVNAEVLGKQMRALEVRIAPVIEGDTPVRHAVIVVHDVTARKSAEEMRARSADLEQQILRMQETSRLKSEFLANMSHELRTPLNAIIGFAELLHHGRVPVDAPEHNEFLGDILSSGKHLLRLLNDILDLSKIEAGKIDLHPEPVRIEELVREVCSVLGGVAADKEIQVTTEIDPTLGEVVADPSRLKQILYNYLSNALKFTPAGGRVVIRVQPDGDATFLIDVEDTGVGIAPADIGRLFVEFQQLDSGTGKRHQGTGLGLALTKRLAEAQGGSVGVTSTLGAGSAFRVILPRRP